MSKTIKYSIAIAVLLILNLTLVFTKGLKSSSSFDDALFVIEDVNAIQAVVISQGQNTVELSKGKEAWELNKTYEADESFLQVLFSILNQVKVKRIVGTLNQSSSGSVEIQFGDEVMTFDFASDQLGTSSYFIQNGSTYQVEVPGYRDNVVNIFQLSEDQWRSRVVFDGSWRSIQKLNLTSDQGELAIRFVDQFFEVDGIAEIDSSGVVDYLNQFQVYQANEMISPGRFPELDSLIKTEPIAVLKIDDIQSPDAITFEIFPNISGQSYHLVTKNKSEMMVFDRRRIQSLLKFREDFAAN